MSMGILGSMAALISSIDIFPWSLTFIEILYVPFQLR